LNKTKVVHQPKIINNSDQAVSSNRAKSNACAVTPWVPEVSGVARPNGGAFWPALEFLLLLFFFQEKKSKRLNTCRLEEVCNYKVNGW